MLYGGKVNAAGMHVGIRDMDFLYVLGGLKQTLYQRL